MTIYCKKEKRKDYSGNPACKSMANKPSMNSYCHCVYLKQTYTRISYVQNKQY